MRSASEDPEIKDFAKIIRAVSARLNKISAVDNKELLKSLLREENSDDKHSLPISSISFTDDERKEQLSIQEDHEESPCCPLSSVQIVPPLPLNPTSWESLSDYEGCMSRLGEDDDDCQSETKLTMCSHSCEL